jgi:transketolase
VDLYSIPFDSDKLLDLANAHEGMVLTVEDNYGASIGSAVADAMAESGEGFQLEQMCVRRIPKSAREPEQIMAMCGLNHEAIVQRCLAMLGVGV